DPIAEALAGGSSEAASSFATGHSTEPILLAALGHASAVTAVSPTPADEPLPEAAASAAAEPPPTNGSAGNPTTSHGTTNHGTTNQATTSQGTAAAVARAPVPIHFTREDLHEALEVVRQL